MRFRKGSRVEVFSFKEAPYGSWRSAEIISGNGHTYSVRYYSFGFANNEIVEERVPRKVIRPCPPQIDVVDRWEAGDLVEVLYHNVFWKTATVLEELSGKYYVVRLLGGGAAEDNITVHRANLRVRQSWQDERWVVIGKVSCSMKSSTLTGSDVHENVKAIVKSGETSVVSLRLLKRSSSPCDWSESAESCTTSPKKIRSMEKEGSHQHRSDDNKNKSGFRQMVRVRSKKFSECVVGTGSSVYNDCYDTDACSVGSCNPVSYCENDTPTIFLDGTSSQGDAESSQEAFGFREEAQRLSTYRSTLGKLFASGPFNWDEEASLTDLRISLNISTDEHLMELRNLKSAGVGYSSFSFQEDSYNDV